MAKSILNQTITINGILNLFFKAAGIPVYFDPNDVAYLNMSGVAIVIDHKRELFSVVRSPRGLLRNSIMQTVMNKLYSERKDARLEARFLPNSETQQNRLREKTVRELTMMGYKCVDCQNHYSYSPAL